MIVPCPAQSVDPFDRCYFGWYLSSRTIYREASPARDSILHRVEDPETSSSLLPDRFRDVLIVVPVSGIMTLCTPGLRAQLAGRAQIFCAAYRIHASL